MGKVNYDEVDLVTKEGNLVAPARMPRTAIISVVRDRETGYLNAAPYSAGVLSIEPFHIIFGVKSWDSKFTYKEADEFTVSIPRRDQIDYMWAMACSIPKGINEIDIAGWTELPSREISTPGIKECPLNLECRKVGFIQLRQPMRAILIGEVVGITIDNDLLEESRSENVRQLPMYEATSNPYTGLYGPSVLSGELLGALGSKPKSPQRIDRGDKTHVSGIELYEPENQTVLMNAIWPRPSYILVSHDDRGNATGTVISGGLLMSARPSIQIPLPKTSPSYAEIKRRKEFVISIPVRSQIPNLEALERSSGDIEASGFQSMETSQIDTPGIRECPVNIECKNFLFREIEGADYALLIGKKVGLSVDEEITRYKNMMQLYSQYIYAVMDQGMVRRWGFQDESNLTVKPLPTWGSRYHGGWWTGPEQYQAGMQFWLLELVQSGYITEEEFFKIRRWLSWWRREGYPAPEPLRSELKKRLTELFKMMVWAHRDYDKWHRIHEYLEAFPYQGAWKSP